MTKVEISKQSPVFTPCNQIPLTTSQQINLQSGFRVIVSDGTKLLSFPPDTFLVSVFPIEDDSVIIRGERVKLDNMTITFQAKFQINLI